MYNYTELKLDANEKNKKEFSNKLLAFFQNLYEVSGTDNKYGKFSLNEVYNDAAFKKLLEAHCISNGIKPFNNKENNKESIIKNENNCKNNDEDNNKDIIMENTIETNNNNNNDVIKNSPKKEKEYEYFLIQCFKFLERHCLGSYIEEENGNTQLEIKIDYNDVIKEILNLFENDSHEISAKHIYDRLKIIYDYFYTFEYVKFILDLMVDKFLLYFDFKRKCYTKSVDEYV